MAGWSGRPRKDHKWRVSGPIGCLLWLVVLLVILIVAAVLFGGFQTGTKVNGAPQGAGHARIYVTGSPALLGAVRGDGQPAK
jgi:hypothetical protein